MREHNITCRPRLNAKDRGVLFVVSRGCDSFGQQHYMDNRHGASLNVRNLVSRVLGLYGQRVVVRRNYLIYGNYNVPI